MAFGMINDYGTILMLSSTIILISYSNTSIHVRRTGVCEVERGLVSSVLTRLEHLVPAGALALVLEGRAGVHLGGGAGGRRLEVLGVDALAVLAGRGLGPGAARAAAGLVPRHLLAADQRPAPAPGLTRAQVPGEPAHLVLPEAAGGQGLPGGRAAAHRGLLLLHRGGLLLHT